MKTGPKPRTNNQLQAALDDKRGRGTYIIVGNVGADGYRIVRHNCGNEFKVRIENLMRKNPTAHCPCEHKRVMVVTPEMHRAEILDARGHDFELVRFVKGKGSKCTYRHVACDQTFRTTRDSFNLTRGCPYCNGSGSAGKLTIDGIQTDVNKVHGSDNYQVTSLIKNENGHVRRIMIRHKCGYDYEGSSRSLTAGLNRCPKCFPVVFCINKKVEVGGETFTCQGHEPITLRKLAERFPLYDIVTAHDAEIPKIRYKFEGTWRTYTPDFYIKSRNTIIEVKGVATMGLNRDVDGSFFGEHLLEKNQAKARQCIKKGFRFIIHLYNQKGHRIKLPLEWIKMDKYQLALATGLPV